MVVNIRIFITQMQLRRILKKVAQDVVFKALKKQKYSNTQKRDKSLCTLTLEHKKSTV
jgi:hypothetical protein